MSIAISPLELVLDAQNPRFIILERREQADIRKYLMTYEDVCHLAVEINEYGSLLPGERIVVLHENNMYVVIEGNRRTCALQVLLSRDLIPDGFEHIIPSVSVQLGTNCQTIDVDILPDRDAALGLMTKRHIEGVKEWKPLAKKQFFAANYNDGHGQSVRNLSRITGVREGEIKGDIRDYKFFHAVYRKYCSLHPEFDKEIVILKTDPFWRIFNAKFVSPSGENTSPKDILKISYDDTLNTISSLPSELFEQITQIIFKKAIVEERITTRNTMADIEEIQPLLRAAAEECLPSCEENLPGDGAGAQPDSTRDPAPTEDQGNPTTAGTNTDNGAGMQSGSTDNDGGSGSGGPRPGGPPPRSFFETICWRDKLKPDHPNHQGLLVAINELYNLSSTGYGRQKAYKQFPIATGMILRTVYEQALRLRLIQVNQWGPYCQTLSNRSFPTLKSMEDFINLGTNKAIVFPDQNMLNFYDRVIAATHRDFLNANIHYPGNICVTAASLEAIAAGGMYALVQGIINMIE